MGKNNIGKRGINGLIRSKSQVSLPKFQTPLNTNKKQELVKSDNDLSLPDDKRNTLLQRRKSMSNLLSGQGLDRPFEQSDVKKGVVDNDVDPFGEYFDADGVIISRSSQDLMGSSFPKDMESPPSYQESTQQKQQLQSPPPSYQEANRNFKVANNGDIILPRQDTPQSKIPLNIMPQTTEEYQGLFSKDSIELTPPLNAITSRKRTQNELAVDFYVDKDNPKGIETITYSGAISLRLSALENQIAESQKKVEGIIQIYSLRNEDKKVQQNALSSIKYDNLFIQDLLDLSNLKQSLATNQIMLVFQQQAELLQDQVDPNSPKYVKYNSEEKKLIAKIQQEATILYNKGVELDGLVAKGANQKRADKLVNSDLIDTKFSGLTTNLRSRDEGVQLDEVNPHYSLDDLKVILKQFQKANKEMGALLKMPDVSKRCGLLASLYDCTTALAKRTAFLIPQTAAAAVSIVEYGISTVVVDTVKQGLTSAKNAGEAVWKKRDRFISDIMNKRAGKIFHSLENIINQRLELKEQFLAKTDEIMTSVGLRSSKAEGLQGQYKKLKAQGDLLEIQRFFDDNKLIDLEKQIETKDGEWIPEQIYIFNDIRHQIANLEETQKELERKLEKADSAPVISFATAVLGVPAAVIGVVFSGVAKGAWAGVKNTTVNVIPGIKRNYKSKATEKVKSDEGIYEIKNKSWNKSLSKIYNADHNARDEAHKQKAEAAEAKKALPNEIKQQKTLSSEFKLPESEGVAFVRQNRQAKLQEYRAQTEASIEKKDAELENRIGGVKSLIQPATPENVIKNRILTEDKELLKDVVELTKLKQQNAVSKVMLPFLEQAEYLERQVYADKPKEQKVNEEIQDLALSLAEKASVLNEKIDKEISSKRADQLENNTLEKDLSDLLVDMSSKGAILNAVMGGDDDLKDLERIRAVFQKANKQMEALIKMPDVSKRCGLLASLYDLTTSLAKSSAFLIPQTAVAAASIVEYAIMTVVVDTIKQGWTSAKNAGKDVWEKRNRFVKKTIDERTAKITTLIEINKGNIQLYEGQLEKRGLVLTSEEAAMLRYEFYSLQEQQKELERRLKKAASAPVISFATAVLGVPEAVIGAVFRGGVNTIVAGAKNITFNASEDKQLGKRWEKRTTDEHGKKKSWARTLREVHSDDRKARGESHKDKAERGIAARELKRRTEAKGNKGPAV